MATRRIRQNKIKARIKEHIRICSLLVKNLIRQKMKHSISIVFGQLSSFLKVQEDFRVL